MTNAALTGELTVWRLVADKHAAEAFSGEGARRFGGRWNRKGEVMVYTAATRSLAVLEMFVQADPLPSYAAVSATFPARLVISFLDGHDLSPDWRDMPAPESLCAMGSAWLSAGETCVLRVPSAIIPAEYNYLINPTHPDFARIRLGQPELMVMDKRLLM